MRLFIDSDVAREIVRPILFGWFPSSSPMAAHLFSEVVNEYFRIMNDIESDIVLAALQVNTQPYPFPIPLRCPMTLS
jgi:hypothetical protein